MALKTSTNEDFSLVDLQVIADSRGSLSSAEMRRQMPFVIDRTFIVCGADADAQPLHPADDLGETNLFK